MLEESKLPSNRSFGYFFTFIFVAISGYGSYADWTNLITITFFIVSIFLFFITLFTPKVLTPFNKLWLLFGHILGKIISPIIIGLIFLLLITPVAILTRLFGRDELRLKFIKKTTYWIKREPSEPNSNSFKNQF